MPLDLFTIRPLVRELNSRLAGGKIDKVSQPEEDEIRMQIRSHGKTSCLVLSASPRAPRLHITEFRRENPLNAYDFCMLLRKYVCGATLTSISIVGNDRTVRLTVHGFTEMLDEKDFYIYVELMNRYSNIVLTTEDDVVIDAIKRIPLDIEHEKCVLPREKYHPCTQPKLAFCTPEAERLFDDFGGTSLREFLQKNMSGFSTSSLMEFLARAKVPPEATELTSSQRESLVNALREFSDVENSPLFAPCHTESDKADFFVFPYDGVAGIVQDDSMNAAADAYFTKLDSGIREQSKKRELLKIVSAAEKRLEKSLVLNREKLAECDQADEFRIKGELLTCNLHKLERGDKVAEVENYYTGEVVRIALDELKSPSQNANAYYAKYQKLKRARAHLEKQIEEKSAELEYLHAIRASIEDLRLDEPMSEIEGELTALGLLKRKGAKRREKPSLPLRFEFCDFVIMKGRNNLQNDNLTFKTANGGDLWLHLKAAHGSHVIVFAEGRTIPENVVQVAAEIAAANCKAKSLVDYTERRNVKRKPGGFLGMVNYVQYQTILVEPNGHPELLIK